MPIISNTYTCEYGALSCPCGTPCDVAHHYHLEEYGRYLNFLSAVLHVNRPFERQFYESFVKRFSKMLVIISIPDSHYTKTLYEYSYRFHSSIRSRPNFTVNEHSERAHTHPSTQAYSGPTIFFSLFLSAWYTRFWLAARTHFECVHRFAILLIFVVYCCWCGWGTSPRHDPIRI